MEAKQLDAILDFLDDWPTDDSLSSPFVNSISHRRFFDGNLSYLPSDNEAVSSFWHKQIFSCSHFYVYAILNKWFVESLSSAISERKETYFDKYLREIVEEIEILLNLMNNNIQSVNREYLDSSINTLLNDHISNISLLHVICSNYNLKSISQRYSIKLTEYLNTIDSKSILTLLIDFLSSDQPKSYNNVAGRFFLCTFLNILSERYKYAQFHSYTTMIKLEYNLTEWEQFVSKLKTTSVNCLKYCDASCINIDGITLGFTCYSEADRIKKEKKIEGKSDSGSSWTFGKIEYNGTDISFNPKLGDLCCGMHLYNGWDKDNCKNALNHFLRIIFMSPNLDSKEMSYNDFVLLLKKNNFFELQAFHYPPKYWHYSARWRQVNPSHICDFIFSIDAPKTSSDEELAKKKKDISIQLDICLNDYEDQDELFKIIPPDTSTDSYDYDSSNDSYEFDMGFMGLVGG